MRLVLSKDSKKEVYNFLKKKYGCNSIGALSEKFHIPKKTLESWFYSEGRTIPESFIGSNLIKKLHITEKLEDNWGQVKGGKKSYLVAIKKHGEEEMKRRQSLGGSNAAKIRSKLEKPLDIDITNPILLEFYGSLLGDGWLSHFKINNKNSWIVGLCGNLSLDKSYIEYYKNNVNILFNRLGYTQEKPNSNTIQFIFKHKQLVNYLNQKLDFPIGKKSNLKIHDSVYYLGYQKVKWIIRGIFDTDGSFYLYKNKSGSHSPCISIHMKEPILIKQIGDLLTGRGFKLSYSNNGNQIKLKGNIQLLKWMNEIGASNKKHLNKIDNFLSDA